MQSVGEILGRRMILEEDKTNKSPYIGDNNKRKIEDGNTINCDKIYEGKRTAQEAKSFYPPMKRSKNKEHRIITIAHVNAHGIKQKKDQLEEFLEENGVDVMAVAETHCAEYELLPRFKDHG
mmetsp:Transcript_8203/g.8057  ORF Transcript_8203/g.8057 Transcript_8203/m.8057 type:complete len:122 (+) Transcript_8203:915-1280(+)